MTKLILHIGPAKCGSTSIQQFFAIQNKPCVQSIHYEILDPSAILELNSKNPSNTILTTFTKLLATNLTGYDVIIFSHEYLFQCPYAIKHICKLAKDIEIHTVIIGYSRKQSDFLISAYSQWGFRSAERNHEAIDALRELGFDPVLFTGIERHLISSIINDFYSPKHSGERLLDWHDSYKKIYELVHELGTEIKCGVLPNKGSNNSLIQDFCQKADLILRDEIRDASQKIFNKSFNQDIVEAINNAVILGFDMPGPHDKNEIIELLSNQLCQKTTSLSEFLFNLRSYIDSYFSDSNHQLCQDFDLSETYFASTIQYDKQEILSIITREVQQRTLDKSTLINNYRMLSAQMIELCLKLAKSNT